MDVPLRDQIDLQAPISHVVRHGNDRRLAPGGRLLDPRPRALSDIRSHQGARPPRTNDDRRGFWRRIRVADARRQASFAALRQLPAALAVRLDQAEGLQPLDELRRVVDADSGAGAAWKICVRVEFQGLLPSGEGGPGLGGVGPGPWGDTVACIAQAANPNSARSARHLSEPSVERPQARIRLARMTTTVPINAISTHRVWCDAFKSSISPSSSEWRLQDKRPWHARDDCQGLGQTACRARKLCRPDHPTFGADGPPLAVPTGEHVPAPV